MGGTAPANQPRLSFTGSEDGEAETETCRAAKLSWRTTTRTSGPRGLNLLNRRMRTRLYRGVGGEGGRPSPLCRFALVRVVFSSAVVLFYFHVSASFLGFHADVPF